MKKILAVLLAVALFPACAGLQQHTADPEKWKLVWAEEFNVDGIPDPKKWSYEKGFLRNRELQYFTDRPQNVRVENGTLVLEAIPEAWPNDAYEKGSGEWSKKRETAEFTSGSIHTRGKASWTYGRTEVRLKVPKGVGTHLAVWTLGDHIGGAGWPAVGEIDIMEYVGYQADIFHASIHTEAYNHRSKNHKTGTIHVPDAHRDFHVFAMEWDKDKIELIVDSQSMLVFKKEGRRNAEWPFDNPQSLLLTFSVGGNWGGRDGIDKSAFPSKFLVDYVRVYKRR